MITALTIVVLTSWSGTARADQPNAERTAAAANTDGATTELPMVKPPAVQNDASEQPGFDDQMASRAPGLGRVPGRDTPRLIYVRDYSGDLLHRRSVTGDWFGLRQDLMENGIGMEASLTQIMQGNLSGGSRRRFHYQGGLNIVFGLDTGAAGLWHGGLLKVKAEGRYGRDNNLFTGALMPVNYDALFPIPSEDSMHLSEFFYMQFLSDWLAVVTGKLSPRENNAFSGDETEQFLNTAFNINPAYATTLPQSFLGVGVLLIPHKDVALTTLILDSEGRTDECGFDTAIEGGTSVFQKLEVKIRPFGLPGNQRIGWTWSDKSRAILKQDPRRLIIDWIKFRLGLGNRPTLDQAGSDWSLFYDFDQYLYVVPGTQDRGIGVFGRFGVTDGRVNPVGAFYSLGLGGKGLIPGRENDSFGVGYYYLARSDKVGPIARRLLDNNEQGVELYYNYAVTTWLKITPNLQVISPIARGADCTWVAGLRVKMDF